MTKGVVKGCNRNLEYVCIYNRCSTEEESQKNALEVQARESVEIVSGFKGWIIVDQFVESQSGTSIKGREKYQTMIAGIEQKKYTIVMIKSIDRLVRNTKDWYLFLDCIIRNGVKLYIYIDNKFYSQDDNLITGIKAMLAAEFSRELSKKIKNAHRRRQNKKSGLNITLPIFGWDKVEKDVYMVNAKEADALREACDLLENGYGYGKLSRYMYNKGVRGKNGKMITEVQWRKMIRSPRIYGTVILHQYEYDFDTQKRVKVPENEWIYIKDALPPIITKEHYDRLIKVLDERAAKCCLKNVPNKIGENDLSTKLYCGECGKRYHRRNGDYSDGKKVTWVCSTYIKMGKIKPGNPYGCNNLIIREEIIKKLIIEAYREKFSVLDDYSRIIDETLRIVRKTLLDNDSVVKVAKLHKEMQKIEKNKNRAIEKLIDGTLSDDDYKSLVQRYEQQMEKISKEVFVLEEENCKKADLEQRLTNIENELKDTNLVNDASNEEILKKVKNIEIFPNGIIKIKFDKYEILNNDIYEQNDDDYTVVKKYEFVTAIERKKNERRQALEVYIREHDVIRNKDIQETLGLKYAVIYSELKRLQEEGKIEYIKKVGGGFWKKI